MILYKTNDWKSPCCLWENAIFLWPFSTATLVCQKISCCSFWTMNCHCHTSEFHDGKDSSANWFHHFPSHCICRRLHLGYILVILFYFPHFWIPSSSPNPCAFRFNVIEQKWKITFCETLDRYLLVKKRIYIPLLDS